MNADMPHIFDRSWTAALGFALVVVAVGCDSKSEKTSDDESESVRQRESSSSPASEPDEREPARATFEARHERAIEVMERIVEAARAHFESADDPEAATFPGGTDVQWASTEAPPEEGGSYRFGNPGGGDRDSSDGSGAGGEDTSERDPIADVLGLEPGTELPVKIVYRTGEGRGTDATATLEVIADFDPSSEADHTLVQELAVDAKTGDVNVFPRLTRNRWE